MTADTTPGYDLLYDIIRRRSSVRKLKPDPIPDGYIDKILEAGRWAMSGANSQPWEYIVVKDPQGEKGSVSLLLGRQHRLYLLDGAAAGLRAAPSGLSNDRRRSGGAPAARRRLVRSAGVDRRRRRRPAPVGHGAGRAYLRPRSIASHRRFGEHLHVHASGRGVARAGDPVGDDSRSRTVQESSRRAGFDDALSDHSHRLSRRCSRPKACAGRWKRSSITIITSRTSS